MKEELLLLSEFGEMNQELSEDSPPLGEAEETILYDWNGGAIGERKQDER
ncbi:MAG: hypothetical protein HFH73_02505 [Lachnospiraceae bacterium]|jgi:hypothetical protein|nr:hypothetical protein [Lachnospiraceae bacterium]